MSLIRHSNEFAHPQRMVSISQGHAQTAPSPASELPSGWWIVPMATLGAAMWYWIITGLMALI